MSQSEQINELAAALAKAQGAMSNAAKNRVNPHFKSNYADLASVLDAIREPLAANGLSFTQMMGFSEGNFILRTMLLHSSGQYIATEYPLPASGRAQEMGAAQTYARRYSLAALVGVAQDDDDGNTAPVLKEEIKKPEARITAQELDEVKQLLKETNSDTAAFCRVLKVASLMEITPTILPNALAKLNAKKQTMVVADAAE
jgi:hypothetical protein